MDNYVVLEVFDYSSEAQIVKSKLESEGVRTQLADETTIDADPLISNAIGGVKLLVHSEDAEKALAIYNEIRSYETDVHGSPMSCNSCQSNRILIAPAARKNIFYMLFPFFEKTKHVCNDCKTVF